MQIIKVKIGDIIPYENNVKLHPTEQVEQIKKSIEEFGNNDPIAIDENNVVIEGHGRLMALQELGYKDAECIVISGLTEEQKNAYRLVHNKLTMNSDFDLKGLQAELDKITIDMSSFDFDIEALEKEISKMDDSEREIVEDDVPEPPVEPKSKLGDIYQLGNHILMCGDSTKKEDINKLLNGIKIDLVLTDPPYGIDIVGKNGKVGADNLAKNGIYMPVKGDETTETTKEFYNTCSSLGINNYILFGGNYFINFLPFSDSWVIWDKRGDMSSNNFADGEMAWCSFHTPIRIYKQIWSGMIKEGESGKRVHPTQKPIKMLCDILNDFSNENDNILDAFGGSGSTLIACEQLNRTCYMMEYEPYYVDVIITRWETLTGGKAVRL